jgi:hypothetical protein
MRTIRAGSAFIALAVLTLSPVSAAILTGNVSPGPASVDLTVDGNTDWIHWGLTNVNDINRKISGLSQISDWSTIGAGTNVVRLPVGPSTYSWNDGNPTLAVNNTETGVYINNFDGPGRGFQFTVPADLLLRTLFVYVGEFSATGTLTASLNDGSGLTYSQALNGAANQTVQGKYNIDFQANAPGSILTIRWVETAELGGTATADNITLQAAALCLPPVVPEPSSALLFAGASLLLLRRQKNRVR